jgi:hypothetical protein
MRGPTRPARPAPHQRLAVPHRQPVPPSCHRALAIDLAKWERADYAVSDAPCHHDNLGYPARLLRALDLLSTPPPSPTTSDVSEPPPTSRVSTFLWPPSTAHSGRAPSIRAGHRATLAPVDLTGQANQAPDCPPLALILPPRQPFHSEQCHRPIFGPVSMSTPSLTPSHV